MFLIFICSSNLLFVLTPFIIVLFSFLFTFRFPVKDFSLMTASLATSRRSDVAPTSEGSRAGRGTTPLVSFSTTLGMVSVLLGILNGFTSKFNLKPNRVNPGLKDSNVGSFLVGVSFLSFGFCISFVFGESVLSVKIDVYFIKCSVKKIIC